MWWSTQAHPAAEPDLYLGARSTSTSPTNSQPATPPQEPFGLTMQKSSPIDIATPSSRHTSSSPSSQQVKPAVIPCQAAGDSRTSATMSGFTVDPTNGRSRQDSFAGAKPISMNNPNRNADGRPRRESLAGSLVGGMSWGGVSVGSWIRDDIIMAGTSPFPYQSPSYHSSSYLPKLEANFMRDFSCCGQTLATLHDLLQHYEECHAQQTPQSLRMPQPTRAPTQPDSKAAIASQAATAVQQQAAQQYRQQLAQQQSRPQSATGQGASALSGGIQQMRQQQQQQQRSQIQHQQQRQQSQPATPTASNSNVVDLEMDGVEDMEMDDAIGPMEGINDTQNISTPRAPQPSQQTGFGQQARAPTLNMSNTGLLGGLRTSQPTTPATTAFAFNTNPTVSSVNTPNLTTQAAQQGTTFSPDSSIPGTPAEDEDFSLNPYANLNLNNMNWNLAANELGLDYCIDEPAKRLFSPNGAQRNQNALQQQFASFGLANGGFGTGNTQSDLMARYRQQQMMAMNGMNGAGAGGGVVGMGMGLGLPEENKPFRCPVIGCEKAYKNQNGLKYHKQHGHQSQQLHDNADGTFSIVNPDTLAPYPGTLGMEKEKPYKCEVCGKRYKNLNGLKYHKQHSPPCNPELKLNGHLQAAALAGAGGMQGVNVAGLPGIGEESMM